MENLTIETLMKGLAIAQELAERANSRGDQNGAQRLWARAIKIRAQIAQLTPNERSADAAHTAAHAAAYVAYTAARADADAAHTAAHAAAYVAYTAARADADTAIAQLVLKQTEKEENA